MQANKNIEIKSNVHKVQDAWKKIIDLTKLSFKANLKTKT